MRVSPYNNLPNYTEVDTTKLGVITYKQKRIGGKEYFILFLTEPLEKEGEIVGYVRVTKLIAKNYLEAFKKGFLVDDIFLYVSDKAIGEPFLPINILYEKQTEMLQTENYFVRNYRYSHDNKEFFHIIAGYNKELLNKQLSAFMLQLIVITTLLTLFFFSAIYAFTGRIIVRPINGLIESIHLYRERRIFQADLNQSKEITHLSEEFERLVYTLERSFQELEHTNKSLENIIDTVPIRIFWKDREGRYVGVNQAFLQDMGVKSKEAILGKSDFDLLADGKGIYRVMLYE